MIAVEVSDQDGVDAVTVDPRRLHRRQGGRAAVDQERAAAVARSGADMEAGVQPPAAAEGVSAAQEPYPHSLCHPPRSRSEERRVGRECVSTYRSRRSPSPSKKKTEYHT